MRGANNFDPEANTVTTNTVTTNTVKAIRLVLVVVVGVGVWSASEQSASAQGRNPAADVFRRYSSRRPSVSPYLNLLNNNPTGTATPYQSLVRPQLEQQRVNQQQQQTIQGLQQHLRSQARANVGGAGIERGTGHQSVFMNYLHYYPGLSRR